MLLQYVVWSEGVSPCCMQGEYLAIAYARMNDQEMPGYMCHKDVSP